MLPVAKILKSNGTEGDILIGLLNIDAEDFNTEEPVFIEFDGLPVPFFIESLKPRGRSRAIIHITDTDNLTDAEEMVGRTIFLDAEDDAEQDEDFTGWTLYDKEKLVGVVSDIEDIPGNPCLCIGDTLVPLHEDFIISADPDARVLVMDLPEGLL